MSGTLVPDSTGHYTKDVLVNGKMSYLRDAGTYAVWWHGDGEWYINLASQIPGYPSGPYHMKAGGTVNGVYGPMSGASGTATVTFVV